jgi:hypothetical protein
MGANQRHSQSRFTLHALTAFAPHATKARRLEGSRRGCTR